MNPLYDWIAYLPRWQAARAASQWTRGNGRHIAQALAATWSVVAEMWRRR